MAKIKEKNQEIEQANAKKEQLTEYNERVNNKMAQLKEYENFLRRVQLANPDEFSELDDILKRYGTLEDTNKKLKNDLNEARVKNLELLKKIDTY